MFDHIIAFSIRNKLVVGIFVVGLIVWGIYSLRQLPIDAVPDITNNQVQVITTSPTLATQEVEAFITAPIERALQNIQQRVELRSISRFGLSVVTIVFEESMDPYLARQLVEQQLAKAEEEIPPGLGTPEMAPISTGLGEIYQYVIRPAEGYEDQYSLMDLRDVQDWIVSRQLAGVEGVVEVNTLGGKLRQYEVAIDPNRLKAMNTTLNEVFTALVKSNENTGGSYIDKNPNTYYIRTDGLVESLADIEKIVVKVSEGRPILIGDLAEVRYGAAPRYGAVTTDGREVVSGTVMMLKGENSAAVTERIKERVEQIKKSLPEGIVLEPYLVRDKLITTAIKTVQTNLIEGGLIVIFILVLLLGNWRAGLIVASVIPLSMLFAVAMMNVFGISANLMSLGAIDFGLIVDGAVIIVEAIVHRLQLNFAGRQLSQNEMDGAVKTAAQKIRNSAAFGEIIILIVYLPILALVGIEGKMFRPMAQTVMLAIAGALILSMTYVPMMSALALNKTIIDKRTIADRIIDVLYRIYRPLLDGALRFKSLVVAGTVLLFGVSLWVFTNMGGEFIPTLEEGDVALHQILPPGSSLSQSVDVSKIIQEKLESNFPEIEQIVTKIGSAEIPTDPMPVETGDIMVILKDKSEWTGGSTRQELFEAFEEVLHDIPGVGYEFSQPIQMRFNELMTGSRADVAVKLYGEDLDLLYEKAKRAEALIRQIDGVGTTKVDQTVGMPQIYVHYNYDRLAQYGLQVRDVNEVVRTAFAGARAGTIYEGERRYSLIIRLAENYRSDITQVQSLYVPLANGTQVPLEEVASVEFIEAPMQISRDNSNRFIVIGVNVGTGDVETLVENIQQTLDGAIDLPAGYYFTYGGQFENYQAASRRLAVAVPIALALIFILLYFTFRSFAQALLIFTAIPLSAIGGIWALQLREMPFSISAGVGFIALFGVAVLNGIVLIGYFNQLKKEGMHDLLERIIVGTKVRLRPVIMTAAVASLGFLPMALSNSGGAEVQRPLATVVIGGLITATFLTLVILPILYYWMERWQGGNFPKGDKKAYTLLGLMLLSALSIQGQQPITLEEAVALGRDYSQSVKAATLERDRWASMSNLPFELGPTQIYYNGEGLLRPNGQQLTEVGVVQQLPNRKLQLAENEWYAAQGQVSALRLSLTENEYAARVKQQYLKVQGLDARQQVHERYLRQMEIYEQIAKERTEQGAASPLELLTLKSASEKLQFNWLTVQGQNQMEIEILSRLLSDQEFFTVADTLTLWAAPSKTGDLLAADLAEAQSVSAAEDIERQKAQLRPSWQIGYGAQYFLEDGWLSAPQAGVTLPLFQKRTRQEIDAQRISAAAAFAKSIDELQQTSAELMRQQGAQQIAQSEVEFYTDQLARNYSEMERVAQLNYTAGALSYVELVALLERKMVLELQLIDAVVAHNQAVIAIEKLSKNN